MELLLIMAAACAVTSVLLFASLQSMELSRRSSWERLSVELMVTCFVLVFAAFIGPVLSFTLLGLAWVVLIVVWFQRRSFTK